MSTNPPPAYAAVAKNTSEGQIVPSSVYKRADPPATRASNPSAAATAIQYGNPIQPASNVDHKIAPPNAIRYVDQQGNRITPPESADVYVPVASRTPITDSRSGSQRLDRSAFPVTKNQAGETQNTDQTPSSCSCACGLLAVILIVIGLALDNLARVDVENESSYITCGWNSLRADVDVEGVVVTESVLGVSSSISYNEICEDYGTTIDNASVMLESSDGWCATQTAATISLVLCILSGVLAAIGVLVVVVLSNCKEPCGVPHDVSKYIVPMVYISSTMSGILALVIWLVMDERCLSDDDSSGTGILSRSLGGSMICQIFGSLFALFAALLVNYHTHGGDVDSDGRSKTNRNCGHWNFLDAAM
eukprot:387056_1